MTRRRKLVGSLALTLGLVGLNLVAFNALLARWSTARLDLTEEGVYSITPATKRILTALDEELVIHGYFSKRTHPKLAPLVPQIEDLVDEYRALSGDRVQVEIVDPGEDPSVEQDARDRYGVSSTPFRLASKYESGIVNAYFALVIRYGDQYVRYGFEDLIEIEPLPDGDIDVRLRNLEYDVTRAIKKVVFGFRSAAELFERVDQPVRLTAVMTPASLPEVIKDVPEAVRKAAEELKQKGGEKFVYEEIDPSGSEAKQAEVLQRFGARPMTLGLFSQGQFYLYGFLDVAGRTEQLLLTGEGLSAAAIREAIEDSLRRQTPGFLKTVGIMSPEPSIPPEILMQLQMQGRMPPQPPPEFAQIERFLEQEYEVREVSPETGRVPTDVDLLLVLKPKNLSQRAVYALDQYLMRGGRVVLCAGSYEADFGQAGLSVTPVDTGLDGWLRHFGIEIGKALVLDDRNQPLPIPELVATPLGTLRTWRMAPYPYLVEVRDEGLANREIAARLGAVGLYWASPIRVDRERAKELEVIEILKSSPRSWTSDDLSRVSYVEYEVPREGTEPQLLAVALSGKFNSFFEGKEPPRDEAGAEEAEPEEPSSEVPLAESPETRLVVVGNAEFLSDFVARALERQEGGFFAENLAFAQNVIDWSNLDNDMLAIRSREAGARRLERTERATELGIETGNYLVLGAAVLALGGYRGWRRGRTTPILVPPARRAET
jgi:ABC-2 type transport system permease protein